MSTALPVARHYDSLDELYRRVWGDHVHHGLWTTGRESPEAAARALAERVADEARAGAGDAVVDVGCGYGATARLLARERGATVTGLTVSPAQARAAEAAEGVAIVVRDWLANDLPDAAFDAAIAIESLSHMPDKPRVFGELARVVKPGGRVVIVDWLARERPRALERRLLLEPICAEGRLPALHAAGEYAAFLREAGLAVTGFEDLTARAVRTWSVVARRLPAVLARDPRLVARAWPERAFLPSLLRIPLAERTGALRLCLLTAGRRSPTARAARATAAPARPAVVPRPARRAAPGAA
ncbi:MAG TPA: methyltransferase domain-containing protein, partial [Solirubrobacteraceae bacterium]|nr:methyltransferase domain-containing protein [Solirubrobacteraceae bacterium]